MPGPRKIRVEGHVKGVPGAEVNFLIETIAGAYPTGPRIKLRRPSLRPIIHRPIPAGLISPTIKDTPPEPVIVPKELQKVEPIVRTEIINSAPISVIIPKFVEEDSDED
jgi:hypothetical protein